MANFKNIILDCDTGRDDALAIWLFHCFKMNLVGIISSYGNTSLPNVVDNNLKTVSLIELDIPVFVGLSEPILKPQNYANVVLSRHIKMGNGLSDIVLPKSLKKPQNDNFIDWLKSFVKNNGKITYVITGPASNGALLLSQLGNKANDYIESIVMMGGKFNPLWDELNNGPDFNIAADPIAFRDVMVSGIPFYLVPMNATYPIAICMDDLKKLSPKNTMGEWAKKIMIAHLEKFAPEPIFRFHDPMVPVAMMYGTDDFQSQNIRIDMEQDGRLVVDKYGYDINIFSPSLGKNESYLSLILDSFFN